MPLIQMTQEQVDAAIRAGAVPAGSVNVSGGAVVPSSQQPVNIKNLQSQILAQGLTGKWTGEGFGTPEQNAFEMARTLDAAGITDIKQFGLLPDGSYGNKQTGKPISTDYNRAGGQIFSGTYLGKDSTGFGVQFGPDGTPYFYTQQGASTSNMGDIAPVLAIIGTFIAPGIGTALGLEGTAAAVVGSAITQGVLSEAQGGNFIDGAVKGAVSAGVAPSVANAVGQSVANVMADSAVKNVVSNAIASSAASAATAALTGGDVEAAAKQGLVGGALGSAGRDIATAAAQGTDPFSQQTQMLAAQEQGLGTAGAAGANIGAALGAIGAGADPTQALVSALSRTGQEIAAATPKTGTSGTEKAPETPVSAPTEAPLPSTGGVAETTPEIAQPSTQEKPIPDQISQQLPGVQEGVAGTIPSQDQQLIDLIARPQPQVLGTGFGPAETPEAEPAPAPAPAPEAAAPAQEPTPAAPEELPVTELPEVVVTASREPQPVTQDTTTYEPFTPVQTTTEPAAPETPIEAPPYDPSTATMMEEVVITAPREPAVTEPPPEEKQSQDYFLATGDTTAKTDTTGGVPAAPELPPEPIPEQIPGIQEGIAEGIPEEPTTPEAQYAKDFYITGGYQPKQMGPTVRTLGQALAPPLFPTAPVSGLTSYRGAGEIEGQQTGKQRRNVWNEASLRLKDALGL